MEQLELLEPNIYEINLIGKYLRKDVPFEADNGWQNKWTYKVGWSVVGTDNVILMAMTDGMIIRIKNQRDLRKWIEENGMVLMSRGEVLAFMSNQEQNYA